MVSMTAYRNAQVRETGAPGRRRPRAGSMATVAAILAATALGLVPESGRAADDPRDATFLAPMLQRVLETARTDVETPWSNPATGHRGNIVVERTFYREPGTPCRAFARTLESAGAAPQVTRGTGCRSSTGLWLIEEEPETTATAPREAPRSRGTASPPREAEPQSLAEIGPTCPDTVLVPTPSARPPTFAYTLPSRAEL